MKTQIYWTLADDEETPIPVPDDDGYGGITHLVDWMMSRPQDQGGFPQVAFDLLPKGGYVSTIFLCIGVMWHDPPRLWETMAFDGEGKILAQHRSETKQEALQVHALLVEPLTKMLDEPPTVTEQDGIIEVDLGGKE